MPPAPERSRTYRNHHIDSTRWDAFTPRADDIVIATSYKARVARPGSGRRTEAGSKKYP